MNRISEKSKGKMRTSQVPGLYILLDVKKGRCIHSLNDIPKGSLIEVCPVITFSTADLSKIHDTRLHDYYFLWGVNKKEGAIALGYGSLYNHHDDPNAKFEIDIENDEIRIYSIRDISGGEEITINYVDSEFRKDVKLWF